MASGRKKERRILAVAGAAALSTIAINLLISAINAWKAKNAKKRDIPGSNVRISLSPSGIHTLVDQLITKSQHVYDLVASVPVENVAYSNVIAPLAELEEFQFPLIQSCVFPNMVAVSDEVRKASLDAEKKLHCHFLRCRQREDVYRVIKAFIKKGEWLAADARRYVQGLVMDFERNGVNLSLTKKKDIETINLKIDQLSSQYIRNLNGNNEFLLFCEQELAGMPPEFIESLENTESGMLKVYLRSREVSPILEHCKLGTSRKLVAIAYGQRCGQENLDILENLVQLRHKLAQLLGYPNYAEFIVSLRMAKTSAKVFEFLEHLSSSLTDLATRELNVLKDLKRKEEGDSPFGMEDLLYYMKRAEEQYLDLNLQDIKDYFPVNLVISGTFRIFQDLFGLRFDEIKDADVWHETVQLYSVLDTSSNELLGYFYLDIVLREGKYAHTCVVPLQNGCSSSNKSRKIPIALLISNLPKQTDGFPALLKFSEVVTLLHEFTHVVHHICSCTAFSRLSGLNDEADFVEIPGQLLENWCYEAISLKMLSGLHKDITKSVTSEMCRSLKQRRDMFSGIKLKQEILFCLIDQIIHSSENVDIVGLVNQLHPQVMLGLPLLEGANPASSFPRFAVGYEAVCYSYLWSEAFAADIFTSKFRNDMLNLYAGLQFRNKVFGGGSAKEPSEIMFDYLGREPSIRSFVETKITNSLSFLS